MARIGDGGDLLKCSFCGKSQKQVKKLIAGPGVYICDECIDLCNEIIEEELTDGGELRFDDLPTPIEIRTFRGWNGRADAPAGVTSVRMTPVARPVTSRQRERHPRGAHR